MDKDVPFEGIVADATSLYEDWRQCQIITI